MHVLAVHRQDQHWLAGELALDVAQQVEPAAAGHGEVEDRHVPVDFAGKLQGLIPVGRFPYYGRRGVGSEHLLETVADDRMVIGYEDSHFGAPCL
jgi:hypothetical protein